MPDDVFERLVARLRVRLLEFARSRGVRDRADDVVQETLLVLITKYAHLRTETDLAPVAFTTCRYKILESFRKPGGKPHGPLADGGDPLDPEPPVEERLVKEERRRLLYEAISRMGLRCRQLLRLWLQGKSAADIAKFLGGSEGAVYTDGTRCRQALFREFA